MIIDKQALFSDDQEITTSCVSDNVYDCGADEGMIQEIIDKGLMIYFQITTAFVGGNSLYIILQTDDNGSFNDPINLFYTEGLNIYQLEITGRCFRVDFMPIYFKRYLRLYYTVSGIMTAGAINSGLVIDKQSIPSHLFNPVYLLVSETDETELSTGEYITIG